MVKVYAAQNPSEAHLLKGLLESFGIRCKVTGEALYSARGELPLTPETAPAVWIEDDTQFEEARKLIKEFETSDNSDADNEVWICKSCGEDSESQFTHCWNCGTLR